MAAYCDKSDQTKETNDELHFDRCIQSFSYGGETSGIKIDNHRIIR